MRLPGATSRPLELPTNVRNRLFLLGQLPVELARYGEPHLQTKRSAVNSLKNGNSSICRLHLQPCFRTPPLLPYLTLFASRTLGLIFDLLLPHCLSHTVSLSLNIQAIHLDNTR